MGKCTIYFETFLKVCPWYIRVTWFDLTMNSKYSLYILAYVDDCHLPAEALVIWILIFILQIFILKNNLERQHLLMILLLRQIHEKLARGTLDNSPMKKISDNYYKWLFRLFLLWRWYINTLHVNHWCDSLDNKYIAKYTGFQHMVKILYMLTVHVAL